MATTGDGKKLGKMPFQPEIDEEPQNVSQEVDRNNLSGVSKLNTHQGGNSGTIGISELEQMLIQMTFTRSETEHLIALLHSRTIQESPSDNNFLVAISSSRVVEEDVASPTDLAKAYKGSTSGISQALRQDSKLISNNATCLPKPPMALLQHPATIENLPDELLSNIFIRLFAKQLGQMRSVSKSWNALLSQSSFIESHLHHPVHNNDQILLVFHDKKELKQFTTHSCRSPHLQLTNFIKLPVNPKPEYRNGIRVIGAVNGLICSCYGDSVIHICNPFLSAVLTLPPYSMPSGHDDGIITYFRFGYDPKNDDYKLVKLTGSANYLYDVRWWMYVEIYSMRKGSWKLITERPPSHITWIHEHEVICVDGHDGHLHWLGCTNEESDLDRIVALNLGSETFCEIPLPYSLTLNIYDHSKYLGVLDGKLCVMAWGENDAREVWVMEEYGVAESWVKRHVFSQFTVDTYPFGFTSANKFLIQDHNHRLVLYDPATEHVQILKDYCSYKRYGSGKIVEYADSLVWVAPTKREMMDGIGQH